MTQSHFAQHGVHDYDRHTPSTWPVGPLPLASIKPGNTFTLFRPALSLDGVLIDDVARELNLHVHIGQAHDHADQVAVAEAHFAVQSYFVEAVLRDDPVDAELGSIRGMLIKNDEGGLEVQQWTLIYSNLTRAVADKLTPAQVLALSGEVSYAVSHAIGTDEPFRLVVAFDAMALPLDQLHEAVCALPRDPAEPVGEQVVNGLYFLPRDVLAAQIASDAIEPVAPAADG